MRKNIFILPLLIGAIVTVSLFIQEATKPLIVDCRDPVVNVVSGGTVVYEYSGMYITIGGQYRRGKREDQEPQSGDTVGATVTILVDSGYKQAGEQVVNKEGCIPRAPSSERYKAIIEREKSFIDMGVIE